MNPNGFEQFGSADALVDYLITRAVEQYSELFGTEAGFVPVPGEPAPEFTPEPEPEPEPEPTDGDTNNQVDGVDEADLVETDGEFIYQVNGQTLTVVDASDASGLDIAAQVRIPAPWLLNDPSNSSGQNTPTDPSVEPLEPFFPIGGPTGGWSNIDGIFLQGDSPGERRGQRLTVISSGYAPGNEFPIFPTPLPEPLPPEIEPEPAPLPEPISEPAFDFYYFEPGQPQVQVTVIDVSNPANLSILESSVIEGNLVSSRAVGDEVYVVTNSGISLPVPEITENGTYETEEVYLARVRDQILDLALPNIEVRNQLGDPISNGLLIDPSTLYTPFSNSFYQQLTTVSTFDVGDENLGVDNSVGVVLESVDDIFSSAENIYLLRRDYSDFESGPDTEIFKVGLDSAELLAKGEVPGTFDNQFSADEYEGFFRISTTTDPFTEESLNNVYVLEQKGTDLALAGNIEGLAPGERIFSTRFQGDYGFVVTFRQVDPLFTLDLSDPRSPEVAGELKLPGFSEYLQVIEQGEQTLLLGIGLDADPETGIQGNLKVSLFDVTDLSNPREIDSFVFEGDYATSEALWDHRAVRYISSQKLLAIPTQVYNGEDFTNEYALTVFEIDGQTGIERLGEVDQNGAWINRSLGIQGNLYAVSSEQISAHTFSDLDLLSSVNWETTELENVDYITWNNATNVGSGGTENADTLVGDELDNILDGLGGDDTLAGGLGDDILMGMNGDDVLRGDLNERAPQDGEAGGHDIIFGGEGSDRIGGKAGNDILSGDAGDDFIWGDDGDDIIMGVTGNDTLVGDNFSDGSGSDLFVFGNGDGTDTILDFEVGIDRIGLVEGELLFTDLSLTQDGSNTLLGVASSGEVLAVLNNVMASALSESDFATVSDVSNPEEALAIF